MHVSNRGRHNPELRSTVMKEEERIKTEALIDNTAQGIFNNLKEIENKREIYERRWVWELLQNAIDVVLPGKTIQVEILRTNSELIFTHNGRPFKATEVAHLIYHGSTKKEQDLGQFGTGFLTTHLLSRKLTVRGVREDEKHFEFILDRNGESSDEIKTRMEVTWDNYLLSLEQIQRPTTYTAQYVYPLTHTSLSTVLAGIQELIAIAPFVLAFNGGVESITITEEGIKVKFSLTHESVLVKEPLLVQVLIKEEIMGRTPVLHEVWKAHADEVDIALKVSQESEKTWRIESLDGIPRLFLAFPLFGTSDLPFPVVVNSRAFEPTEKRDGVYLGAQDTPEISQNKRLIERAGRLFLELLSGRSPGTWSNVHTLLQLHPPPRKDWLDQHWYSLFLKSCISEIEEISVLRTESGRYVAPAAAFIPADGRGDTDSVGRHWDLCYALLKYREKLPARDLATDWLNIIANWEPLGFDMSERMITLETIAAALETFASLDNLQTELYFEQNPVRFLNGFYSLLLRSEKTGLLETKPILPDQNGTFQRKSSLFKDDGIDQSLKDIAASLEIDLRSQLLHSDICEEIQLLIHLKKQGEVLDQIVNAVRQPRGHHAEYLEANLALFNWILESQQLEYIEGYPVLSSNDETFATLTRKDKLLAPTKLWKGEAANYGFLFPQDLIVSSLYLGTVPGVEHWRRLAEQGLILTDPLFKGVEVITDEQISLLMPQAQTLDEGTEHESTEPVEISNIFMLEKKDKGIIDVVRKSKDKARTFLAFLFDYVIENDDGWKIPVEFNCICGSQHSLFPALWLGKLKDRAWIPVRKDKSGKPTAQDLARIMETDSALLQRCTEENPSRFLNALDIRVADIMMDALVKTYDTRVELDRAIGSLYGTFRMNPGQLTRLAKLVESEPLLIMEEIEERLRIRERVRMNQYIGSTVEDLLKQSLQEEGLEVETTGRGSDFLIEYDYVKDNVESIIEVKSGQGVRLYVEVKSTNQDIVKMTLTQAKEAKDNSDSYVLCVVERDRLEMSKDDIKQAARFVLDIGARIEREVNKAEDLKERQEAIRTGGDIEIEMSEGPIRFKISRNVWKDGNIFIEFIDLLRTLRDK